MPGIKEKLLVPDDKICDYIDGTFRNDTPEEYVRQILEKRLINELQYNRRQIKIEYTLHIGSKKPRVDIAIWEDNEQELTQENIKIIVECKKETVSSNSTKDGIEQLKSYMAVCANCEFGLWTNGKEKCVFKKAFDDNNNINFIECSDIPSAKGSLEDVDRPKRPLVNAFDDNLLLVFKRCHNYIYANDGLQKQPAFF